MHTVDLVTDHWKIASQIGHHFDELPNDLSSSVHVVVSTTLCSCGFFGSVSDQAMSQTFPSIQQSLVSMSANFDMVLLPMVDTFNCVAFNLWKIA